MRSNVLVIAAAIMLTFGDDNYRLAALLLGLGVIGMCVGFVRQTTSE